MPEPLDMYHLTDIQLQECAGPPKEGSGHVGRQWPCWKKVAMLSRSGHVGVKWPCWREASSYTMLEGSGHVRRERPAML